MLAARTFTEERKEVQAILTSGVLSRAPGLEQLFVYITTRFFEGSAEELKEYSIAVDAFGRAPDFDQKRDSIVRVQARRLRERLAEYYATEGADHPIQITIPNGQYAPKFVSVTAPTSPAEQPDPAPPPLPALPNATENGTEPGGWRRWFAVFRIPSRPEKAPAVSNGHSTTAVTPNSVDSIRILAGLMEGEYIDNSGRVWQRDQHFQGGVVFSRPTHLVFGTREQRIFRSGREGNFSYDIPLAPGVYELRLYFAETMFGETGAAGFGGEATRVFDIFINGVAALKEFDVICDSGAGAASIKMFKDISPAADGYLHLSFVPHSWVPFLNAIEISPGLPGRIQRIRMVAQAQGYIDKTGHYWEPDVRYASGGQLVRPGKEAADVPDPGVFAGGRFGNITYTVPVPPGRYGLRLYMSETWNPDCGGFDILCNGVALERQLNIRKQPGTSRRVVVLPFDRVGPDFQGRIVLSLLPSPGHAFINALEIIDQTPQ
jgi:Malectin domain